MRELAERLDMTTAAIYYHYTDKADILSQLLKPTFDDMDALIAQAEDAELGLEDLLEPLLDLVLNHRRLFQLLNDVSATAHPAIAKGFQRKSSRLFGLVAGPEPDGAAIVRAAAVLGVLTRPVIVIPETAVDIADHRNMLLEMAACVQRVALDQQPSPNAP